VTPQITPDGFITLQVLATNNSVGSAPTGSDSPPPVNTKEVQTQVLVRDGQTVVLGGIYNNSQTEGQSAIPALGDMPVLGWMFKNRSDTSSHSELLVFITPRIIEAAPPTPAATSTSRISP
ncbi:MAG: hypothetical protein H7831_17320, partial [Magnetococcus sp. WYHC-3]